MVIIQLSHHYIRVGLKASILHYQKREISRVSVGRADFAPSTEKSWNWGLKMSNRLVGRAFQNIVNALFLSSPVIMLILTGVLGLSLKYF